MSPATPETLANALRGQARAAASALARGACARTRARADWRGAAARRARLLDVAIDAARHCLAHDAPESTCTEVWVRRVIDDVLPARTGPAAPALKRVVETCTPVVRALVRARLAIHTLPTERPEMLERLDRLCAALDECRVLWHLPVARLPVLEALPEAAWRGLERAPAWAVVRALGETAACDLVYLRGLETLARSPGRWAAPRVAAAARTERITLECAPDPGRVGALLAQWRWPAVEPPLAMVAAFADTARTEVTHDAWAAALTLAPCGDVPLWISAEQHASAIERQAAELRIRIDAGIEREALRLLAHWLLELDGDPPSEPCLADANDRAYGALEQMRTLWASEPCLAPRGPDDTALRLEPEAPGPVFSVEADRLDGALRAPRLLVWRVSSTDPARAIVGNCGVSGLHLALAEPASFELCTHSLDTPVVLTPTPAHARPAQTARSEAVETIVERVAERWGP